MATSYPIYNSSITLASGNSFSLPSNFVSTIVMNAFDYIVYNQAANLNLSFAVTEAGTQISQRYITGTFDCGRVNTSGVMNQSQQMNIIITNLDSVSVTFTLIINIYTDAVNGGTLGPVAKKEMSTITSTRLNGDQADASATTSFINPVKVTRGGYLFTYAELPISEVDVIYSIPPITNMLNIYAGAGSTATVTNRTVAITTTAGGAPVAIRPSITQPGPDLRDYWLMRCRFQGTGQICMSCGGLGVQWVNGVLSIRTINPDPISLWTVTSASVTAGSITITLFGQSFAISIAANTTTYAIAYDICTKINALITAPAICVAVGPTLYIFGTYPGALTTGTNSVSAGSTGLTMTVSMPISNLRTTTGTTLANDLLPSFPYTPTTGPINMQLLATASEYIVSLATPTGEPVAPVHRMVRPNNDYGYDGHFGVYCDGSVATNMALLDASLYKKVNLSRSNNQTTVLQTVISSFAAAGSGYAVINFIKLDGPTLATIKSVCVNNQTNGFLEVYIVRNAYIQNSSINLGTTIGPTGTIFYDSSYSSNLVTISNNLDIIYFNQVPSSDQQSIEEVMSTMSLYSVMIAVDSVKNLNTGSASIQVILDECY